MRAPTAKPRDSSSPARPRNFRPPNSPSVYRPWANLAGSGKITALGSDVTCARAGAPPNIHDVANAAAISFASRFGVNVAWSHGRGRLEERRRRREQRIAVVVQEAIVVVAHAHIILAAHG